MNTERKILQYLAAALMFIMLAVFLIDNPYKGYLTAEQPFKVKGHFIYMCVYYFILALWFFNMNLGRKVKSKIYVLGVAIGLIGATSQLISCHLDYEKYYTEMDKYWYDDDSIYNDDYEVFKKHYPLKEEGTRGLLRHAGYIGCLALAGILCTKARKKYIKYALFANLALLLFVPISELLPLYGEHYDEFADFAKSHEKMMFISQSLLYLSWAITMVLYKDEETETPAEDPIVRPAVAPAAAPALESDETIIETKSPTKDTTSLRAGTLALGIALQNGRYTIEGILGQGGFGVTYLATQTGLNRKVAIKEFFMKEYCDRDITSNHITMGTAGSREMVAKFKSKFIKEAQTIAELQNQHIVRIYDIFEENGTAYYVMEYIDGGSLAKKVLGHPLDNETARKYIGQICQALEYIHERNILHLDIKPSNLLFRNDNELVLIDFGVSKHYDEQVGSQTSSTPVGISRGYAPLEQYNKGGVIQFSPATDIYSLGATLYSMITGLTPPDANEIYEDGLDNFSGEVSPSIQSAIIKAMDPRRKQRPQSIDEFKRILNS